MFAGFYLTLTYMHFWRIDHVHLLYLPNTEIIMVNMTNKIYLKQSKFSFILVLVHPFAEEFYWREFV